MAALGLWFCVGFAPALVSRAALVAVGWLLTELPLLPSTGSRAHGLQKEWLFLQTDSWGARV